MNVLRGGRAYIDGELVQVDIAFGEQIEEIAPAIEAEDVIECADKLVLPGMIDVHVHFRDFNQSHKETWRTGGWAAVEGGVTTVMEMPNTDPPTTTPEMIREKRRRAGDSPVHFGLFGGISAHNMAKIAELAGYVEGFKLYMGETTGRLVIRDRRLQREACKRVADTGKVLAVHAQHLGSKSEAIDVEIALEHAVHTGVTLHLCHVRTRAGVELAQDAKDDGLDVTVETCPHYLVFTERDARQQHGRLKVNPPLAASDDRDFLWKALNEGVIDILASDHAPHTLAEKDVPFDEAPYGLPGVETTLPLMLDAVDHDRISLKRLIEVFAENPAKRFGFHGKGRIAVGGDADLVVVDLDLARRVEREEIVSKCGWSPYEGLRLKGWPVMTVVKGKMPKQHGGRTRI